MYKILLMGALVALILFLASPARGDNLKPSETYPSVLKLTVLATSPKTKQTYEAAHYYLEFPTRYTCASSAERIIKQVDAFTLAFTATHPKVHAEKLIAECIAAAPKI